MLLVQVKRLISGGGGGGGGVVFISSVHEIGCGQGVECTGSW